MKFFLCLLIICSVYVLVHVQGKFNPQKFMNSCSFFFQICLKLILVTGRTAEFLFSPSDTAYYITQHVFDNWPEGRTSYFLGHSVLNLVLNYVLLLVC